MQKVTLLIDGNFFVQRLRNSEDLNFIENPEKDEVQLIKRCTESLCYEIANIESGVDNIIIAKDFSSWRKKLSQVYPLTTTKEETEQDYKRNRDAEKNYDEEKFYAAYDKWISLVQEKFNIQVIRNYLAEADDICFLVSRILLKDPNNLIFIWSSDGDYYQMVKDRIMLIKLPKKELWLEAQNTEVVQEKLSLKSIFEKKDLSRLKQIKEGFETKTSIQTINPIQSVFGKIISGDQKDNVPPLWTWSLNARNYRPSDSHIKKAFKLMEFEYDNILDSHLYDKALLSRLFFELFFITKQHERTEGFTNPKEFAKSEIKENIRSKYLSNDPIQLTDYEQKVVEFLIHTELVYDSNRKMKYLNGKEIPKDIISEVLKIYLETKSQAKMSILKESSVALQTIGLKNTNSSSIFNNLNK